MKEYKVDVFSHFSKDIPLLTAGKESFNTMLIGWGGLGTLWSKPVATVYVRESRYTLEFLDNNDYFTLSFLPEEYKKDLIYLGRHSGRDEDKVANTSLTPVRLEKGVTFKEAKVTLVCKKLYKQLMDVDAMPEDVVKAQYADGDIHYMFIGEVVDIIE